jgi:small neutral amino acid transporter SnatA (MarC family)
MMRRLPMMLGALAALATLLLVGPVAVAVVLLRSSSDAHGPTLAAQIFIAVLVVGLCALAFGAAWGLTRLVLRLLDRSR